MREQDVEELKVGDTIDIPMVVESVSYPAEGKVTIQGVIMEQAWVEITMLCEEG